MSEILIGDFKINLRYYGACCLNQFVITPADEALAAKLVEIYFVFFKVVKPALCSVCFSYQLSDSASHSHHILHSSHT